MNILLILPTILAIIVTFAVVEYFKRKATTIEGYYVANRGANIWLLRGTYVGSDYMVPVVVLILASIVMFWLFGIFSWAGRRHFLKQEQCRLSIERWARFHREAK